MDISKDLAFDVASEANRLENCAAFEVSENAGNVTATMRFVVDIEGLPRLRSHVSVCVTEHYTSRIPAALFAAGSILDSDGDTPSALVAEVVKSATPDAIATALLEDGVSAAIRAALDSLSPSQRKYVTGQIMETEIRIWRDAIDGEHAAIRKLSPTEEPPHVA